MEKVCLSDGVTIPKPWVLRDDADFAYGKWRHGGQCTPVVPGSSEQTSTLHLLTRWHHGGQCTPAVPGSPVHTSILHLLTRWRHVANIIHRPCQHCQFLTHYGEIVSLRWGYYPSTLDSRFKIINLQIKYF